MNSPSLKQEWNRIVRETTVLFHSTIQRPPCSSVPRWSARLVPSLVRLTAIGAIICLAGVQGCCNVGAPWCLSAISRFTWQGGHQSASLGSLFPSASQTLSSPMMQPTCTSDGLRVEVRWDGIAMRPRLRPVAQHAMRSAISSRLNTRACDVEAEHTSE